MPYIFDNPNQGFDPNSFTFNHPQVDLLPFQQSALLEATDPISDALEQKKKKSWLEQLASEMAGDRYMMTNESDQKLALNQALIALGRQFSQAAGKGDWGAIGTAFANGMGDAGEAFHGSMGELSKRRVANENMRMAQEAALRTAERDKIETTRMKEQEAARYKMAVAAKEVSQGYRKVFDMAIGDTDITDVEREQFNQMWDGVEKMFIADPTNPQYAAKFLDIAMTVGDKAGRSEDVTRAASLELQKSARLAYGNEMPIDQAVDLLIKDNNLEKNLRINQLRTSIRAQAANAKESEAKAKYYESGGAGDDDQLKASRAEAERRLGYIQKDDDLMMLLKDYVSGRELRDEDLNELRVNGFTDKEQAQITLETISGVRTIDDWIAARQSLNQNGGLFDRSNPVNSGPYTGEKPYEPSPAVLAKVRSNPELRRIANSFPNQAALNAWLRSQEGF